MQIIVSSLMICQLPLKLYLALRKYASQAESRGFESRLPLHEAKKSGSSTHL